MFSWDFLAPLILFAIATTATPGPNNLMAAFSGMNFGYRRTLPHIAGVTVGFTLMIFLLCVGLGGVFLQFPLFHSLLRGACFLFVLYLAWKMATATAGEGKQTATPMSFWAAAMFQWVNPKAWAMSASAAALFTGGGADIWRESALTAAVFLAVAPLCVSCWTVFGVAIGKFMRKNPKALRAFNAMMALLLLAAMIPVFV